MNEYSKYLFLKNSLENLFGKNAWYALKESNSVRTWRGYITKTLKALRISIHETVEIYDEAWLAEIDQHIDEGLEQSKVLQTIDELVAVLAATLINVSFLQTGLIPERLGEKKSVALRKGNWRNNKYRQVVYLQTKKQREDLFWDKQQQKIGCQEQWRLYDEYVNSKTELSYSEWYKQIPCNDTT